EKEVQLRRVYGGFGALWVAVGAFLIICQMVGLSWAANLFLPGFCCLAVGLLYSLTFLRNEEEADWHKLAWYLVGGVGAALALTGFIGGNLRTDFLVPNGLLLALLALGYLWSFVAVRGPSDELGEMIGLGIAGAGVLGFVVALVRSYIVPLF